VKVQARSSVLIAHVCCVAVPGPFPWLLQLIDATTTTNTTQLGQGHA
jgi:hypothetical protein